MRLHCLKSKLAAGEITVATTGVGKSEVLKVYLKFIVSVVCIVKRREH